MEELCSAQLVDKPSLPQGFEGTARGRAFMGNSKSGRIQAPSVLQHRLDQAGFEGRRGHQCAEN